VDGEAWEEERPALAEMTAPGAEKNDRGNPMDRFGIYTEVNGALVSRRHNEPVTYRHTRPYVIGGFVLVGLSAAALGLFFWWVR
jgi:hypothetical protein